MELSRQMLLLTAENYGSYYLHITYAKEVPLFHLGIVIYLAFSALDKVELWVELGWNFM